MEPAFLVSMGKMEWSGTQKTVVIGTEHLRSNAAALAEGRAAEGMQPGVSDTETRSTEPGEAGMEIAPPCFAVLSASGSPIARLIDKLGENATVGGGPGNLRARNLRAERRLEITNQGSLGLLPSCHRTKGAERGRHSLGLLLCCTD